MLTGVASSSRWWSPVSSWPARSDRRIVATSRYSLSLPSRLDDRSVGASLRGLLLHRPGRRARPSSSSDYAGHTSGNLPNGGGDRDRVADPDGRPTRVRASWRDRRPVRPPGGIHPANGPRNPAGLAGVQSFNLLRLLPTALFAIAAAGLFVTDAADLISLAIAWGLGTIAAGPNHDDHRSAPGASPPTGRARSSCPRSGGAQLRATVAPRRGLAGGELPPRPERGSALPVPERAGPLRRRPGVHQPTDVSSAAASAWSQIHTWRNTLPERLRCGSCGGSWRSAGRGRAPYRVLWLATPTLIPFFFGDEFATRSRWSGSFSWRRSFTPCDES